MTVRITKDQQIGGVPARDVRDILRKRIERSFSQEWLAEELYWLRVKGKDAYKLTRRQDCLVWLKFPEDYIRRYRYYPDCRRQWSASRRASAALIKTLVAEGFIELEKRETKQEGAPWYSLTERGAELCRGSAAKPVHRKSADATLEEFMERVHIVNKDDERFSSGWRQWLFTEATCAGRNVLPMSILPLS